MGNKYTWIAVIDDEEGIRRALLRLLRSAGIEARAFSSGEEFFQNLGETRPACLLLDLHMPELTGFVAIEKLIQIAPDLPVIILTGQTVSKKQRHDDLSHAFAILQKPINDQELFSAIEKSIANCK